LKFVLVVYFPFICYKIETTPVYGIYNSQLIQFSRACGSYQDFLDRGLLKSRTLLNQGFLMVKLKSSLRKFYRYGKSVSQMITKKKNDTQKTQIRLNTTNYRKPLKIEQHEPH
jgi:hypothetical protein